VYFKLKKKEFDVDPGVGGFSADSHGGRSSSSSSANDSRLVKTPQTTKNAYDSLTFPNGDRYEGEFKADLPHGHGVYKLSNGDKFEGKFKNGKLVGSGIYTSKDDDSSVMVFVNDKNPLRYNKFQ